MVVGVGDEQFAVGATQSARFVKLGLQKVAVFVPGLPVPAKVWHALRLRKQPLDFVVVGVGDIDDTFMVANRQRMLQPHGVADAVTIAEVKQANADQSSDETRLQIGDPNGARLAVGKVKPSSPMLNPLGCASHASLGAPSRIPS